MIFIPNALKKWIFRRYELGVCLQNMQYESSIICFDIGLRIMASEKKTVPEESNKFNLKISQSFRSVP